MLPIAAVFWHSARYSSQVLRKQEQDSLWELHRPNDFDLTVRHVTDQGQVGGNIVDCVYRARYRNGSISEVVHNECYREYPLEYLLDKIDEELQFGNSFYERTCSAMRYLHVMYDTIYHYPNVIEIKPLCWDYCVDDDVMRFETFYVSISSRD